MGRGGVAKDGSEKCARETYYKKKTKRQTKKKKRLLFSVLRQNLKYPITTAGQPIPTGPPLWTDYNKSHIIRSRSLSRHSISAFGCVRGHDRLPLTFSWRPVNSVFKLIQLFLQRFKKKKVVLTQHYSPGNCVLANIKCETNAFPSSWNISSPKLLLFSSSAPMTWPFTWWWLITVLLTQLII